MEEEEEDVENTLGGGDDLLLVADVCEVIVEAAEAAAGFVLMSVLLDGCLPTSCFPW